MTFEAWAEADARWKAEVLAELKRMRGELTAAAVRAERRAQRRASAGGFAASAGRRKLKRVG